MFDVFVLRRMNLFRRVTDLRSDIRRSYITGTWMNSTLPDTETPPHLRVNNNNNNDDDDKFIELISLTNSCWTNNSLSTQAEAWRVWPLILPDFELNGSGGSDVGLLSQC